MTNKYIRGLSPRARGSLNMKPSELCAVGPIPACAGEPYGTTGKAERRRAYPRVRGGAIGQVLYLAKREGLSPRARGSHGHAPTMAVASGPIPACAGEPGPSP